MDVTAEQLWKDPDWKCPRCGWMNKAIRERCRNFDCGFNSALVSGDSYFPVQTQEEAYPVCHGCTEVNGTDGWTVVRHAPPLCHTSAEIKAQAQTETVPGQITTDPEAIGTDAASRRE
jgi:hypothetical protein